MKDKSLIADEDYARSKGLRLWGLPESQKVEPWKWRGTGVIPYWKKGNLKKDNAFI